MGDALLWALKSSAKSQMQLRPHRPTLLPLAEPLSWWRLQFLLSAGLRLSSSESNEAPSGAFFFEVVMNVRNFSGILLGSVLGLCFALFPLSSLATVTIPETHAAYASAKSEVDRALSRMVRTSPGVSVRTTQGLSGLVTGTGDMVLQSGAAIRSGSGVLSPVTAGLQYGGAKVKSAAGACLRAPVRCNLVGVAVGLGFQAVLDSVDGVFDSSGIVTGNSPGSGSVQYPEFRFIPKGVLLNYQHDFYPFLPFCDGCTYDVPDVRSVVSGNPNPPANRILARIYSRGLSDHINNSQVFHYVFCKSAASGGRSFVGFTEHSGNTRCLYSSSLDRADLIPMVIPQPLYEFLGDDFHFDESDIPFLLPELEVGTPDLINLPTPDPLVLDETIVEVDDGSSSSTVFEESTRVQEYVISDNNTKSPIVEKKVTETRNRYQDGVLVESLTETTVESAQDTDISPAPGAGGAIDIPTDCALYNPFCLWAEWTQQPLDGDEPDLSSLLAPDVEPEVYDSGLGAGACPEPISLSIGFLSRSIEVSYQPLCDYAVTVRPVVLVASYLLAAYMLSGVLRHA